MFFPFFDKKYTKTNGRNVKNPNPFFTALYTTIPIQKPIRDALTILFDHYPLVCARSAVLLPIFYETMGGKNNYPAKNVSNSFRVSVEV